MLQNDFNNDTPPPQTAAPRTKRKLDTGSIFVAILVVTAGAGLYFMHWRTADARKLVSAADAEAALVKTFLNGGRENLATLSKAIRETRATVARLSGEDEVAIASTRFDSRNPFVFESLEPKSTVASSSPSNAARDEQKSKLLAAARSLQIQSIMFGTSRRSCLINGKLYFEGQPCGDFTLETITADSVFVRSGEFRFELRFRR